MKGDEAARTPTAVTTDLRFNERNRFCDLDAARTYARAACTAYGKPLLVLHRIEQGGSVWVVAGPYWIENDEARRRMVEGGWGVVTRFRASINVEEY